MILIEQNLNGIETLEEAVGEGKKLYLKGVFMEAEKKNRNGRTYRLDEMQKEVEKITNRCKAGDYILGELDHPGGGGLDISLKNVSHKIVEMQMIGGQAIGKAEILDKTQAGSILRGLVESDVRVGVSSRAKGSLNESGVVSNFSLVTVDAVAVPSAQNAYPESILESLEMYRRGEVLNDLAEAIIHDKAAQRYFKKEMERFITSMNLR